MLSIYLSMLFLYLDCTVTAIWSQEPTAPDDDKKLREAENFLFVEFEKLSNTTKTTLQDAITTVIDGGIEDECILYWRDGVGKNVGDKTRKVA